MPSPACCMGVALASDRRTPPATRSAELDDMDGPEPGWGVGSKGLGTSAKGGQGPQERVTGRRQVAAASPRPNHCPSVTPRRASHPGPAGGFQWLSVLSLSSGSAWRCLHPVSPDRRMHNPGTSLITWCLACLINLDNTRADGPEGTTDPHHWIASVGRLSGVELC